MAVDGPPGSPSSDCFVFVLLSLLPLRPRLGYPASILRPALSRLSLLFSLVFTHRLGCRSLSLGSAFVFSSFRRFLLPRPGYPVSILRFIAFVSFAFFVSFDSFAFTLALASVIPCRFFVSLLRLFRLCLAFVLVRCSLVFAVVACFRSCGLGPLLCWIHAVVF
jgi:hypothetical protein